jgi:hypothetical protein
MIQAMKGQPKQELPLLSKSSSPTIENFIEKELMSEKQLN